MIEIRRATITPEEASMKLSLIAEGAVYSAVGLHMLALAGVTVTETALVAVAIVFVQLAVRTAGIEYAPERPGRILLFSQPIRLGFALFVPFALLQSGVAPLGALAPFLVIEAAAAGVLDGVRRTHTSGDSTPLLLGRSVLFGVAVLTGHLLL